MDLKIKKNIPKITFRKILIYLNIFSVIIFLLIFGFVAYFVKDNVYNVISVENEITVDKSLINSLVVNLDIEQFKNIIKNIEEKTISREVKNFKDIFK